MIFDADDLIPDIRWYTFVKSFASRVVVVAVDSDEGKWNYRLPGWEAQVAWPLEEQQSSPREWW